MRREYHRKVEPSIDDTQRDCCGTAARASIADDGMLPLRELSRRSGPPNEVVMGAMQVDVNAFWRDGYQLVKRVFSQAEVDAFRRATYEALERDRKAGRVVEEEGVTVLVGD